MIYLRRFRTTFKTEKIKKMRKNYLHLDFKGISPLAPAWLQYLEHFHNLGFDGIILELDCKYAWKTWQGATLDHYSESDIKSMISAAKNMNFEVSLLIQIQGHLEWALDKEKYASLREKNFINEICPCNPDAVQKIEEWIDEAIQLCPDAPYLHLGGDEVWHLCTCDKCKEHAKDAVDPKMAIYLEHARRCCEKIVKHGMRPMLWSDMFVSRKCYEPIKTLPGETIIVNWSYHEKAPFPGLKELQQTGYEIWGSPAIRCGWGPDYLSGIYDEKGVADRIANIKQWQQTGINLLNTVWGRPSSFNFLYPPYHCFADAFAAAGRDGETWNAAGDDFFAVQTRQWRELEKEYHQLQQKGLLIFKMSTALNRVAKYIGRRPGLFCADCMKPSEKLQEEIEQFRETLMDFFLQNGLSDAEEFIEERLAMLTPPMDPPENPEREKSEEL